MIAALALAAAHPDTEARQALYDGLVEAVGAYHVSTDQTEANLGWRFEDDLPELERAFLDASTPAQLDVALARFANGLHNPHVWFAPDERSTSWETLPARLDVEERPDGLVFTVVRAGVASGLAVGDVVLAVDGVPADRLVRVHGSHSNANHTLGVARGVARWLTLHPQADGPPESVWTVVTDGEPRDVRLAWKPAEVSFQRSAEADDPRACHGYDDVAYGPYEVSARGANWCLYASTDASRAAFPVVRYISFLYEGGPRAAKKDLRQLGRALRDIQPTGIVVDVRDNGGGNDPNWFLDAFAREPYPDDWVKARAHPSFADPDFVAAHFPGWGAPEAPTAEDLASGWYAPVPFMCDPRRCDADHRFHPAATIAGDHPIAVLVGPGCVSSCDSFTRVMGLQGVALIGEPTAAGHTTRRMRWPVEAGGETLGHLELAVSIELDGPDGDPIEAVPIPLRVRMPRTYANRDTYDRDLVDAAVDALSGG